MELIWFIPILIMIIILIRTLLFSGPGGYNNGGGSTGALVNGEVDLERAAENLSRSVGFKTVSGGSAEEFHQLFSFLEKKYPLVHQELQRETVNDFSLLYYWPGKDPSLKPVLLLGHTDVVPVEEDTEADWSYPPFAGERAEGFVWGRGSMDNKLNVIGQLEAVENLLSRSLKPKRDVYLAFGHDEEIRGPDGALAMARLLEERGLEFYLVLDEGGCVLEDALPGLGEPAAFVGTAEKGFANLQLTAPGSGGHSALPPFPTELGRLARALHRLETKQMKARLTPPIEGMLNIIGPRLPWGRRLILANLWLFRPLFIKSFSRQPLGNALLRTTTAPTMARGSKASNVLPDRPGVTINFRLLPGDTLEDLLEHVKKTVADEKISIEVLNAHEPSRVSDGAGEEFRHLAKNINRVFPGIPVSPYLVFGGTDSRYYQNVCSEIFRFSPMQINNSELKKVHSVNERISEENIERAVSFYCSLLLDL